MKTLRAIILLALLGAGSPLLLQAQTTESFTFTTNRVVPDGNAAGLSDVRNVDSAIGTITSLKVRLKLTGEFNGDLYGYLRHSSGFAMLLNRPGRTAGSEYGYPDSGFDVTLQTGAANGDIHLYQNMLMPAFGSPLTGEWEPDGRIADPAIVTDVSARLTSLTNFNGLNAAGEWTLYLADIESGGTNMLTEWGMDISGAAYPTLAWANPADMVYGTALNGSQLNATATYNSTSVPGTFTYSPAAGAVLNAGLGQTLTVTFTPTDTTRYLPISTNVAINVLNASLIVSVDSNSRIYGSANPALTGTVTGQQNGDTITATFNTSADINSGVGSYAIAPVLSDPGSKLANYTVTTNTGTLAVTRAVLMVTADNQSRIYGAANPTFTASYSGFVAGDSQSVLSGSPALNTSASASSSVGNYNIVASLGSLSADNYSFAFTDGTLTVTAATLIVTADNASRVYGSANPTFAGTIHRQNGDNITATFTTAADINSAAGNYAITPVLSDPDSKLGNYNVTSNAGTLSVTQAAITITVANKSKAYGAALPTFTATYTGFVLSQGTSDLTGLATLTTTATATSDVGSYPITASGATSPNYTFSYVDGTLTITQSLTAGAIVSSANPVLPGANVTFTATVSAVAPGAGTPGGTVNFPIDGSVAGTGTLSGGTAAFTVNSLTHGSHTVVAEYAGNLNFVGTTNALTQSLVINTAPVAANDSIERYPTQGVKVRLSTLLANDSDADSDTLNITVSPASANGGTVTVGSGWLFYTPAADFTNVDSFTYTITDGQGGSATGTVTVAIKVDNAPAENLTITSLGNGSYRINGDGIPGRTYRLQFTTTLSPANWQLISGASVTADSTGKFEYTDTPSGSSGFYRSVYP